MPVCFFGFASKEPVYENTTLYGNHRMEGILLAHGKGIRPGKVAGASLMDLAPTALYLLGHAVPDDMDGKVLESMIDPEELSRRPIDRLHVDESDEHTQDGLSADEQEEIRAKLMGLGYL
jgi:arylsulfatase A-like enzyme